MHCVLKNKNLINIMLYLQVVLEETESGKKVTFPCDKWLSRDEGDGEIIREFAAAHEGEEPLPSKYL